MSYEQRSATDKEFQINEWLRRFEADHDQLRTIGEAELRELAYALHDDIPLGYEASMRFADWLLRVASGRGTCHIKPWHQEPDTGCYDCMECDNCGHVADNSEWAGANFCPRCGRRVVA